MGARDETVVGVDGATPRRAVVLALRGDAAGIVDNVRRQWDPEMAARIDAHVTLLHDVVDHDALTARLVDAAARWPPCEFRLTATACWGPVRYGIFLDVDDHGGNVRAMYDELADLEEPRWRRPECRPVPVQQHVCLNLSFRTGRIRPVGRTVRRLRR